MCKNFKLGLLTGLSAGFLVLAFPAFSNVILLKAIKPSGSGAQSDEQQAILAVRSVKPSVVTVIGRLKTESGGQIDSTAAAGFVVDSAGYIVTNNHVVEDKSAIYSVALVDGTEYPAAVAGRDTYSDIALIKIDKTGLPAVKLGDSDALETGQTVFAIGDPLAKYEYSVTRGVVSGLGRNIPLGTKDNPKPRLQNLIQTDAAINQGNSGGPLINLAGEVIGMNAATDTDGQGLSFAIPINVIKGELENLKNLGKVPRPFLGIAYVTIDRNVKFAKNLKVDQGALVTLVGVGSPAAAAGLKQGDIIVSVNREILSQKNELDTVVQRYQAGNQVLVGLLRDGEPLDLPVILGEFR